MHSRALLFFYTLLVPATVAATDVLTTSAITDEVLATNARMLAAANARDVAAFFAFMTDDCTIVQNERVFPTLAAARADVEAGYRGVQQIDRVFEHPQVTALSADSALLVSDGRFSAVLADGRSIHGRFAVSLVFVRTNGGWKVKLGHYSAPLGPN